MHKIFTTIVDKELNQDQKIAIRNTYSVDTIISIPYPAYIDPRSTTVQIETLAIEYVQKVPKDTALVMVSGELTFVIALIRELQMRGFNVVVETTEATDEVLSNTVTKPRYDVGKHVAFRQLPRMIYRD